MRLKHLENLTHAGKLFRRIADQMQMRDESVAELLRDLVLELREVRAKVELLEHPLYILEADGSVREVRTGKVEPPLTDPPTAQRCGPLPRDPHLL